MTNAQSGPHALDDECRVFAQYLTGHDPTPYVRDKYRDAHVGNTAVTLTPKTPFDAFLLRIALTCPLLMKTVDGYSALLLKRSVLRKKLVLLLAILECSPPTHTCFDRPDASAPFLLYTRSLAVGLLFSLSLILGIVLLVPFHLVYTLQSKTARISP